MAITEVAVIMVATDPMAAIDKSHSMIKRQLVFRRFGPPTDVLEYVEAEESIVSLESGSVLVRILAAPVNPADLNTIEGTYGFKPSLPCSPGIEGCGAVIASHTPNFEVGDRVIFLKRSSTWASHVIVSEDDLFKVPDQIDPLQAAMLKVNPATAWCLLHHFSKLEKGSWIVQNAGNSAVGRCVIQLANFLEINTISLVRKEDLVPELLALGADHVFLDNDVGLEMAKSILGGATAELACNAIGGESALRLMKLLKEGACHITYGAMARKPITIPNGLLIFRNLQIRGLWVSRWLETAPQAEIESVYSTLASLVVNQKMNQLIDSTYQLADFREAIDRLKNVSRSGKVLFTHRAIFNNSQNRHLMINQLK